MTSQETYDMLVKARALIENPKNWTQGKMRHKRTLGKPAYCAVGAMMAARGLDMRDSRRYECYGPFMGIVPGGMIMAYNDHNTHECVLSAFDAAIEKVKQ